MAAGSRLEVVRQHDRGPGYEPLSRGEPLEMDSWLPVFIGTGQSGLDD
ncbi:hypothetical protein GJR88_05238 [Dietzia sp. DQ12-45-1b]|nr:hypothetical protein GJR88_05238 [Dietzia sp. DQ12-45-1b]